MKVRGMKFQVKKWVRIFFGANKEYEKKVKGCENFHGKFKECENIRRKFKGYEKCSPFSEYPDLKKTGPKIKQLKSKHLQQ